MIKIVCKPKFYLIRGKQKGIHFGFVFETYHKKEEPKRCPMCNEEVRVIEYPYDDGRSRRDEITYYVSCDYCGIRDNGEYDNEYDAIESWNAKVEQTKNGKDIGKIICKIEFEKSKESGQYKKVCVGLKELKERAKTKAKWLPTKYKNQVKCSNCGYIQTMNLEEVRKGMKYCYKCGATMKRLPKHGVVVKSLYSNGMCMVTRKTKKQLCEERRKENDT